MTQWEALTERIARSDFFIDHFDGDEAAQQTANYFEQHGLISLADRVRDAAQEITEEWAL